MSPLRYRMVWHKAGLANKLVSCAGLSPDGLYLAVGGSQEVAIISVRSGRVRCSLRSNSTVTGLQWTLDTKVAVLTCTFKDGRLVSFTLGPDGRRASVASELALSHEIRAFAINASSTRLATGSKKDVRIWERSHGWWREVQRVRPPRTYHDNHLTPIEVVSLHWRAGPGRREQLVISYKRHGVHLWDVATSAFSEESILTTSQPIGHTTLSPNGNVIVVTMRKTFDVHFIDKKSPSVTVPHDGNIHNPAAFIHEGQAFCGAHKKGQSLYQKPDLFLLLTASPEKIMLWKAEEIRS
ncbi:WD40 repeat-like protein [Panus rudis PR-1116 ss-1]|nr:WD40 repeat-like protein [Panus rudis PR-1116 ss-1]